MIKWNELLSLPSVSQPLSRTGDDVDQNSEPSALMPNSLCFTIVVPEALSNHMLSIDPVLNVINGGSYLNYCLGINQLRKLAV